MPSSPAYGLCISQLIRYSRDCPTYELIIRRAARLLSTFREQGYVRECFKWSLMKFYCRYRNLVKHYKVSVSLYKRNFYPDVYTIWNRILITIWTICAFRVLNPHQWSLAKQCNFKSRKVMPQKCQNKLKTKRWCINITIVQFKSILTRKIWCSQTATN